MALYEASTFEWDFQEGYDPATMELRDGSNGDMFDCVWDPRNVGFSQGEMTLKIDGNGYSGFRYTGGELRTQSYFGYGLFTVSMKPIKNPGVVTSFFTYTGPTDGTDWDEIDIEFLGYDTTKVQFNYFTKGQGHHEFLYDLGFDASEEFHTYGFRWSQDFIAWYVDGKEVYRATELLPKIPGKIMMNAWPGIGVDDWLHPYNGQTPLTGHYQWVRFEK